VFCHQKDFISGMFWGSCSCQRCLPLFALPASGRSYINTDCSYFKASIMMHSYALLRSIGICICRHHMSCLCELKDFRLPHACAALKADVAAVVSKWTGVPVEKAWGEAEGWDQSNGQVATHKQGHKVSIWT